jgi:MYXO-CTERM domain-containing protein
MFISLDSNKITDGTQKSFLNAKLAAAAGDQAINHVFVWFHHAPYSVGNHGDNATVQNEWVPLFDNPVNKVTAVFSGHDHLYGRFNNGSKVAYIVSGGAGAPLYSASKTSKAMAAMTKSSFNFVALHIAGTLVTGTTYDSGGMTLDTFSLGTPGGGGGGGGTGGGGTGGGGTGGGGEPAAGAAPSGGCQMAPRSPASPAALLIAAALILLVSRRRRA